MGIYEYEGGEQKRYVRATEEDDGTFTSDDRRGNAGVDGYVYTYAPTIEELVAKGIRSYATPFAAGATEYRVTAPSLTRRELTREEAVALASERLIGQPSETEARVERRLDGGGPWLPWRRYTVMPDGSVARTDR